MVRFRSSVYLILLLPTACVTPQASSHAASAFAAIDAEPAATDHQFPDEAIRQERLGMSVTVDHDRCQPGGKTPDWRDYVPAAEVGITMPIAPLGQALAQAEPLLRYDCQAW